MRPRVGGLIFLRKIQQIFVRIRGADELEPDWHAILFGLSRDGDGGRATCIDPRGEDRMAPWPNRLSRYNGGMRGLRWPGRFPRRRRPYDVVSHLRLLRPRRGA